ncbi:MAG: hypothetical protein BA862_12985 [Desulfobulbaceae bacterium S3730MH12]|nr:MAG: hypothetical protein BA866_01395 [Desulfobulbaceae bacterium S5133MH15]OEU58506.1 MAG: hypothetical protein BA862_12985 [Desulfobulbaceae bacterium S3730MH12]OEU78863.1 MAG: hypothetical protein BA873_06380 [Desulfobulbaceae bacterium C00003063]
MTGDYSAFFKVFTEVSKAIHSGEKSSDILESIVTHIKEILQAKGCIFWIVDHSREKIVSKYSHGFSYRSLTEVGYDTLTTVFDRDIGQPVFIEDARHDPRIPDMERLGKRRVGSVTGLFFDIVDSFGGILALYFNDRRELSSSEFELVTALGEQGAIALHRAISYDKKMMENFRQMVEGLTLALEAKDEKTHGHSVKVAMFAKMVAEEMGLSEEEIETIYHGGLLHDIGKIGMEDDILDRLGILSRKEMDIVKQHPEVGARIVRPLVFLNDIEPLILHHHERFNGTGYPHGLKGKAIPLGVRILTVCDVFETMLAGRKYFAKMKQEDAILNLQSEAGSQFDPEVIKALFSALPKNPEILKLNSTALRFIDIQKKKLTNSIPLHADVFI